MGIEDQLRVLGVPTVIAEELYQLERQQRVETGVKLVHNERAAVLGAVKVRPGNVGAR